MKFGDDRGQMKCSFCGKAQEQVRKLVAGPGVYMCDECIELCNEIIEEEFSGEEEVDFQNVPKPKEIAKILDCAVGTVKSRMNRGRELLRQALKVN